MQDFTEDLNKVMQPIYYEGCHIWPVNGKYRVLYKDYSTLDDAKKHINKVRAILNKMTIVK